MLNFGDEVPLLLLKPNMSYKQYIINIVNFLLHFLLHCLYILLQVLLHFSKKFSLDANKIGFIFT